MAYSPLSRSQASCEGDEVAELKQFSSPDSLYFSHLGKTARFVSGLFRTSIDPREYCRLKVHLTFWSGN